MLLQLVQVFALLFVRGKPVSAQELIASVVCVRRPLRPKGWLLHFTAFACSILVPVCLLVLSISSFKTGHYREVFSWSSRGYWPVWVSQVASGLQLLPIVLVPVVALGQTCRYLANGDLDIFQRIQMLYRPPFSPRVHYTRSSPSNAPNNTEDNPPPPPPPQVHPPALLLHCYREPNRQSSESIIPEKYA